jgi:hypothetical protein
MGMGGRLLRGFFRGSGFLSERGGLIVCILFQYQISIGECERGGGSEGYKRGRTMKHQYLQLPLSLLRNAISRYVPGHSSGGDGYSNSTFVTRRAQAMGNEALEDSER